MYCTGAACAHAGIKMARRNSTLEEGFTRAPFSIATGYFGFLGKILRENTVFPSGVFDINGKTNLIIRYIWG